MEEHRCRGQGRVVVVCVAFMLVVSGLFIYLPAKGEAGGSATVSSAGSQEKTIAGEYIVMFHAKSRITSSTGETRRALAALMLELQGEYLASRYGFAVVRSYDAIAETTGKGMFHVRSDLAARDRNMEEKLLSLLGQDLLIESVAPNREQRLTSTP